MGKSRVINAVRRAKETMSTKKKHFLGALVAFYESPKRRNDNENKIASSLASFWPFDQSMMIKLETPST